MHKNLVSFVIILSSLFIISCKPDNSVDISTGWKMTTGDCAGFRDAEFDDSTWETVNLPRILTKNKTRKIIWLRKTFSVPIEWKNRDLALELGKLWDADNTYLNGIKIGSSGSEFPDFFSLWNYDRYYIIPDNALRFGETNVVAIRIFSNCLSFYDGKPFIGSVRSVRTYNFFQRLFAEYIVIALTVLSIFLGTISLVQYFTYREYILPLFYSIGCLLVGLMSLEFYIPDLVLIDYITKDNLFYSFMTLVVVFYYFLLENLLNSRVKVFRIIVVLGMIVAVLISLTSTADDPVQNWGIMIISSLTSMVYILCGILLLRKFRNTEAVREVVILTAGYLINMVCVFHDIFMVINLISPGIFLIPIAFNILYMCFGIVLSLRISGMQAEKIIAEKTRDHYLNEISLAKKVQDQLIPSTPPADYIFSFYKPMEDVGGDFYDFIRFENSDKIGIFISDVSGHGLPAAFITSMLKTTILQSGKRKENPADLLFYINDVLLDQTAGNYITAFYGIYDPVDRKFIYAGAGHPQPYMITGRNISKLDTGRNTALAIFSTTQLTAIDKLFTNTAIQLPEKSKLLLFTDGLSEARVSVHSNICFETVDMIIAMKENEKYQCREFVDNLYRKLVEFRGSDSFEDDICIVCLDVM